MTEDLRIGDLPFVERPANPARPPERSASSHNVERHRDKLLQPLRLLRSDNCVSEQDFCSILQIVTPVSEIPHRLDVQRAIPTS